MDDADNQIVPTVDTDSRPANWLQPSGEPAIPVTPPPNNPRPAPRYSPGVGIALVVGLAGPVLACALSALLISLPRAANQEELPLIVSIFLAVGGLGLPLAWHAWQRMRGRARAAWQTHGWWLAASGALIVLMMVCGQLSISLDWLPTLVLAPLQPLIFIAAAAVVLTFTAGGWNGLSRLRAWGHLISGAWLSISLSFVAEVLAIGVVGLVILIALAVIVPDQVMEFAQTYHSVEDLDLNTVIGWALQPWVIVLAFVLGSIVVPMIEELIKPIGVVLLIGRRPAPMAAFVGGMMGGLGFAVTETLGNLVTIADPWLVLIMARMGTLVMHSLTAGLVGWGWGQLAARRPWRWVGAYAGAVAIHGLWNGLAVATVFIGLYFQRTPQLNTALAAILGLVMMICLFTLLLLAAACVAGLGLMGYWLRRDGGRQTADDPPSALATASTLQ
ncbi:MAG TPA: PrsW family glutamic-type intramembrane protease [Anaerolineales bacterium]|nr:PrsW family glutamic-type intramembrane protease [Anaerolineales bacterium]